MSTPKQRSFKRMQELSAEVRAEVDRRLLGGDTPSTVADWMQTDLKVFLDIKPGSLKKNLERYRSSELKDRVINSVVELTRGKSASGLQKRLLAIEELETLVALQTARFEKMYIKEQSLPAGILLKQASDEMRLLKEMLVELGKLQLETGVMIRAPKKVSGQLMGADGEVQSFSWTEEQETLYRTLENVAFQEVPDLHP